MLDHDAIARFLHVLDTVAPDQAGAARQRWEAATAPLHVQVTGRPWAGRTTVAALLAADGFAVVDHTADLTVYVLPASLRPVDERAIAQLERPIVLLNKADAISPDPAEVNRVCAQVSQTLEVAVLPLAAHVAAVEVDARQFGGLRDLAGAADAGARVATIVFGDSELRAWGPPAVAIAVGALRLNPTLDARGVAEVLRAYSGVDTVLGAVRQRATARASGQFGAFLDVLERCTSPVSARDEVEEFLSGQTAAEIALRAANWQGETVFELRARSTGATAAERRAAIRAERALARRVKST